MKNLKLNLVTALLVLLGVPSLSLANNAIETYKQMKNLTSVRDEGGNAIFKIDFQKSVGEFLGLFHFKYQGQSFPHLLRFIAPEAEVLSQLSGPPSIEGHPYFTTVTDEGVGVPQRVFIEFHSSQPGLIRFTVQTKTDASKPTHGKFTADYVENNPSAGVYILTSGWIQI